MNNVARTLSPSRTSSEQTSQTQFETFYTDKIAPYVDEFEAKRQQARKAVQERKGIALILGGIALLIALFLIAYAGFSVGAGMAVLAFSGLYLWVSAPKNRYHSNIKSVIFPVILRYFGDDFRFYAAADNPSRINDLKQSDILPQYDHAHFDDYVSGTYKGVHLELTELRLTREKGSGKEKCTEAIFHGLALRLGVNKPFRGRTVIREDAGRFGNFLGRLISSLQRVRLEDPVFEKRFEVYSDDQIEARVLLTPGFMTRLQALAEANVGGIQASLYQNKLLILLPHPRNLFEVASAFDRPITFHDEIASLRREMGMIFDMIDELELARRTGL